MSEKLSYVPLGSLVNPSFWNKLSDLKLNVDRLRETERHLWGYFPLLRNDNVTHPLLEVDSTSFNEQFNAQNIYVVFEGKIANKNTIEEFKECDKMHLINREGLGVYEKIVSGEALKKPYILNSFFVLSFADLKKYHFYYWFAFPVPNNLIIEKVNSQNICEGFDNDMLCKLYTKFTQLEDIEKPYFIAEIIDKEVSLRNLEHIPNLTSESMHSIYFAFFNLSNDDHSIGSQLRNYILLLHHYCPFLRGATQKFISFQCKRTAGKVSVNSSVIYTLKLPETIDHKVWVGWERNERDKMGPRFANMKDSLHPAVLAEKSVDLNLKLMKWRVAPDLQLDKFKQTKCLILGAGTLGCAVARGLLAWGVRHITLVDNSTVSFSNPVRQSLFTYEDSVKMRPKAEAAAEGLRSIFPGVISKGFQLTIPMPGHTVGENMIDHVTKNVDTLVELIKQNDVIFLLMDSRESRWLPTMLGSFYNKIVINAALGFDSYLVMRHGTRREVAPEQVSYPEIEGSKVIRGHDLGCYFCNDVTAPGDSVRNRTLDQQCTVTRPAVAQIAGALAVELALSVLQHKHGSDAPVLYQTNTTSDEPEMDSDFSCLLGLVPHSIRGYLYTFSQILPATSKYDRCVACSKSILDQYQEKGMRFLLDVFNSSKHLEDVAKLTELLNDIDLSEIMELSDELSSD